MHGAHVAVMPLAQLSCANTAADFTGKGRWTASVRLVWQLLPLRGQLWQRQQLPRCVRSGRCTDSALVGEGGREQSEDGVQALLSHGRVWVWRGG